eukprot:jgi/Ulvmu1/9121/UM005_0217.1
METPIMQQNAGRLPVATPYEQEVVLLTTVDIAPGYSKVIKMRRVDKARDVAQQFCRANGLPDAVIGALEAHLKSHLMEAGISPEPSQQPHGSLDSQKQQSPRSIKASTSSTHSRRKPKKRATPADQTTVFDRLYQLARAKAESEQAHEALDAHQRPSNDAHADASQRHLRGEYANYGEFLYIEGLANMEHRRQKAQHVSQELKAQELQGATFQPEILEKSRSMRSHVHVPVWQRLGRHSRATSAAKRRAIYQADRDRDIFTECTFKPKINDKSNDMMSQRQEVLKQMHISPYEKLYQDAEVRRKKLEQKETKEVSLHTAALQDRPGSARPLSRSLGHFPSESSIDLHSMCSLPASDRLHAYHLKKEAKLSRAREAPLRDAEGNPLFTPRTGRPPVADARTAAGVPVWEQLYSRRHEAADRRHQLERQLEEESRRSRAAPRVNKRSEQLLHGLQHRRFQQIFEFLDQQQRGTLDLLETVLSDAAEFRTLSSEIRQDLEAAALLLCVERALCEPGSGAGDEGGQRAWLMHAHTVLAERCTLGEAVETVVGEEEFMALMARVVAELPRVPPRSYLLPDLRMDASEGELTFQPVINDRSVEMALQRWPDRAGPVFEHLHDHAKTVQSHRERRMRARVVEELSKCTFKPALVASQSHGQHRTVHTADGPPGSPAWETGTQPDHARQEVTDGSCSQSLLDIAKGMEDFELTDDEDTGEFCQDVDEQDDD